MTSVPLPSASCSGNVTIMNSVCLVTWLAQYRQTHSYASHRVSQTPGKFFGSTRTMLGRSHIDLFARPNKGVLSPWACLHPYGCGTLTSASFLSWELNLLGHFSTLQETKTFTQEFFSKPTKAVSVISRHKSAGEIVQNAVVRLAIKTSYKSMTKCAQKWAASNFWNNLWAQKRLTLCSHQSLTNAGRRARPKECSCNNRATFVVSVPYEKVRAAQEMTETILFLRWV